MVRRLAVLIRCASVLPLLHGAGCLAWSAQSAWAGAPAAIAVAPLALPETAPSAAAAASRPALSAETEPRFDFDLASMPLVQSLERFAAVSGRAAVFPGSLVDGRVAAALRGRYTAQDALRRLLVGTGLQAEEVRSGSVTALVLKPGPAASTPRTDADANDRADQAEFQAMMQDGVWQALCADRRNAQDNYRSLLRFDVDPGGRIRQPRLLTSTGDVERDATLLAALRQVRLQRPPPAQLRQPFTMLITPPQAGGPVCPGPGRRP